MSLTKHKEGSLRELCAIAFPLMLSSLSVLAMVFADRWFLAHFSSDAHNVAVSAMTFAWGFIFSWMSLGGITEVFVSQYHGAGLHHKTGEPVWQMIWLSLFSTLFFLPFSFWGVNLFYENTPEFQFEREYFRIMLMFGPFYVLYASLCGFFVGRGKTTLITFVVIAANCFNILLDRTLIFGIENVIPSLGVKGAAIATNIAAIFQSLILGCVFLNKNNRQKYGTSSWKLNFSIMRSCIRIGLPTSLFIAAELLAYGCYYLIMKEKGVMYITVAGICQTMFLLCFFFAEGLHKATIAIVGNLIGAGRSFLISNVMKSAFLLNMFFLVAIISLFTFGRPLIIEQLLPLADPLFIEAIQNSLTISLVLISLHLFFEGIRLQFAGVLIASGDTIFHLICGISLIWLLMWFPVYLSIGKGNFPVETGSLFCASYSLIACMIYFLRIRKQLAKSISSLV